MKKFTSFVLLLMIFFSACKQSTEPQPPEQKPAGYQEDVPWPSLVDSPWPMVTHDPQSTMRANLSGPANGVKKWSFNTENYAHYSSVAIGKDSSIYFVTGCKGGVLLMKLDFSGNVVDSVVLNHEFGKTFNTPLFAKDEIIVTNGRTKVLALDYNLKLKWEYETNVQLNFETPAIDKSGNIYFNYYPDVLVALNKNGELLWELHDGNFNPTGRFYSITISPDEKFLYVPGYRVGVVAVDIQSKKVAWTYGDKGSDKTIIVDNAGNIYFEQGKEAYECEFVSLDKNGVKRWGYTLPGMSDNVVPTIDYKGNVYTGQDTLYSFDYKGTLRWKIDVAGVIHAPLTTDKNGNVYFTAQNENLLVSFGKVDSEGNLIFQSTLDDAFVSKTALPICCEGEICIPTLTELFVVK